MNIKKQQMAIAKVFGWTHFRTVPDEIQPDIERLEGQNHSFFLSLGFFEVPDYLNDLDAMHEAENMLTLEQHSYYRENLAMVVGFTDISPTGGRAYVSATASQRAEAFLRTLDRWEESNESI